MAGPKWLHADETLRVVTRPDGTVSHLDLASLIFTREPYEASPPIPGGIDPGGWRPLSDRTILSDEGWSAAGAQVTAYVTRAGRD